MKSNVSKSFQPHVEIIHYIFSWEKEITPNTKNETYAKGNTGKDTASSLSYITAAASVLWSHTVSGKTKEVYYIACKKLTMKAKNKFKI